MSVRSFHSVFMASAVAGAALGCYLISLRVASERAALEEVETRIVLTQRDIRLLQTEIGTRARLAQLERWNVRVLSLSAPTADQILGDKFQLARLIAPERKPAVEAPVILATAPAQSLPQPLAPNPAAEGTHRLAGDLLHEASVTAPQRQAPAAKIVSATPAKVLKPDAARPAAESEKKPAGTVVTPGPAKPKPAVRTARADPLAPLPADPTTAKAPRTAR